MGRAPARTLVEGRDAGEQAAIAAVARLLRGAKRPLVYLAPGLSCEAQRLAVGLADGCRASLDNVSSSTVAQSVLASQEIGRATATLGEVRNRADTVVLWDVDATRYPRLAERYAIDPVGLDVPDGRRGRRVISVTVRAAAWPDADRHVAVTPADEVATLEVLAALLAGATPRTGDGPAWSVASELADLLLHGRYVAVLVDAEPATIPVAAGRAAATWRLSHALNDRTARRGACASGGGQPHRRRIGDDGAHRISHGRGFRRRRAPVSAARSRSRKPRTAWSSLARPARSIPVSWRESARSGTP